MLDQNTDRMWYVIGAVIVGAAIIFLANGTLPNLFASVTDSFENASSEATDSIAMDSANLINPYGYIEHYFLNEGTGGIRPDDGGEYYATSTYFRVEGNVDYVFTAPNYTVNKRVVYYDIDKAYLDGELTSVYSTNELRTTSPANAVYARVSTSFKQYGSSDRYAPVSDWWFGNIDDAPIYE